MTWGESLPLLILATSLVTGVLIFLLREDRQRIRITLNMAGATLKLVLVGVMVGQTLQGREFETRISFLPEIELVFRADLLALLFVTLSAVLWFLTTIYAIGYLEGSPHRSRFFGFFSLCVTATMGIALAGNLVTFFVFYELLSVTTYPLVTHRGTGESLRAGRTYLLFTLSGGVMLLAGIVWLHELTGTIDFAAGGALAALGDDPRAIPVFVLLIAGLGVKSALVPLHGWLPKAMVAPAPVSALLHAVAVVKAGVFGIVRVVYSVYGVAYAGSIGVLMPLAVVATITIVYGSIRALSQDNLKRMLAYSTVSQLSYIVLGTAIVGPLATTGALAHLLHQGIMKVTLFFCAGALSETLGIHRISEMRGVGRRMPLTMAAFTLAALGMIGIPPTPGFISKWYLGLGGLAAGEPWVVAVFVLSGILNAMYFLPVIHTAWFRSPEEAWTRPVRGPEAKWTLLVPTLATALIVAAAGLAAGMSISPLGLAKLAVREIYLR